MTVAAAGRPVDTGRKARSAILHVAAIAAGVALGTAAFGGIVG